MVSIGDIGTRVMPHKGGPRRSNAAFFQLLIHFTTFTSSIDRKLIEISGEDITADCNSDRSMATRMDLICHIGESTGSCWSKVEKMESKEKREGDSDGEQEAISK
ncbi:hypothetical protein HA466_0238430 [Hirschfeldia incana]|nr:hypothetical protein HA466_0238430 [Hirschfeldia incana]